MRLVPFVMVWLLSLPCSAQPPAGYYDTAQGLTGEPLRMALRDIISPHTALQYSHCLLYTSERHEPAVLRGMGRYLDDRPTLFVEVLSASVAQAVEAAVQGRGYLYFRIDEAQGIEHLPHIIYELRPGHGFNYLICTAAEAKRLGVEVNAA